MPRRKKRWEEQETKFEVVKREAARCENVERRGKPKSVVFGELSTLSIPDALSRTLSLSPQLPISFLVFRLLAVERTVLSRV